MNKQFVKSYKDRIDDLERLRDIAAETLWPQLHREWLPRLEEEPAFLEEFKLLIRDAVRANHFDPYLEWGTNICINVFSSLVGVATSALLPEPLGLGLGVGTGISTRQILTKLHSDRREEIESFSLFYQRAARHLPTRQT